MWIVTQTPSNYHGLKPWSIMDEDDGDIHDSFDTKEEAQDAYKQAFGVDWEVVHAERAAREEKTEYHIYT